MTLGDILAALAVVFIIGVSWAATILLAALGFPASVARAEFSLTASPGQCAARGAGTVLAFGLLAGGLLSAGAGPMKLLGGAVLGSLGMVAAMGSAGVIHLLARRIDALGSPLSPFGSLTRAAILYVSAGYLPVIGWFFLVPVALLLSLGSGVSALRRPKKTAPIASSFEAVSTRETTT